MQNNNFSSVVIAALVGGMAFWVATSLAVSADMAAAMAVIPTIITHFRWQRKGMASLLMPLGAFLLSFVGLIVVQIAAARYTSSTMDGMSFVLYPCLVMCFTISFSGPLLLIVRRKNTVAAA